MNKITNKLLHFRDKANFEYLKNANAISDTSIAFVEDEEGNFIYTHGKTYMGGTGSSSARISPVYNAGTKIADFVNGDNTTGSLYAPTSQEGHTYSAGDGISINNDTISLKGASTDEVGGIKLNTLEDNVNKRYGVRVDSNGKGYVQVPWQASQAGEAEPGRYYEQAFATTAASAMFPEPLVPQSDWLTNPSSIWKKYAENTSGSYKVWMCTRFMATDGTALGEWQGPWLISGPNGAAGEDGDDIEFIYCRNNTPDTPPTGYNNSTGTIPDGNQRVSTSDKNQPDFVPSGWNDNAQGIDEDHICEWISIRTGHGNTWTGFGAPILWSHWGHNGTDGDGIEYIYCPLADGASEPTGSANPANWEVSLISEYIPVSYANMWFDNPQDLSAASYGPGSKQLVSVRKRIDGVWGRYSNPVMWNVYPKDGVAQGYIVDVSDGNIPVILDSSNAVSSNRAFNSYITVAKNGILLTGIQSGLTIGSSEYIATVGTLEASDGGSTTGITVTIGTSNGQYNKVIISISTSANLYQRNIRIPIQITLDNGSVRNTSINVYGVSAGIDGRSVSLVLDAHTISTDYNQSLADPEYLNPIVRIQKTNGWVTYRPDGTCHAYENAEADANDGSFAFDYYYDSGSANPVTLSTNAITINPGHDTITVRAYHVNNGVNTQFDSETVPIVKDGTPGISGHDTTSYTVSITSNSFKYGTISGGNGVEGLNGSATYEVTKRIGDNLYTLNRVVSTTPEWADSSNNTSNGAERVSVELCGISVTPTFGPNGPGSQSEFTISAAQLPQGTTNATITATPYAVVSIRSNTNVLLASAVIPINMKGDKGDTTQALTGAVIRFMGDWDSSVTYKNGTTVSGGVYYLDVVKGSDGNYYHLNGSQDNIQGVNPVNDVTNKWVQFEYIDSSFINTLIANYIGAHSITADQIVITTGTGAGTTIEAGMVNSSTYPNTSQASGLYNTENVRIFAGAVPTNGDIKDTNFYVTSAGTVKAASGKVMLNSDGSGSVANGSIAWNTSGVLNMNVNPGELTLNSWSTRNTILITGYEIIPLKNATTYWWAFTPDEQGAHTTEYLNGQLAITGYCIKNGIICSDINVIIPLTGNQMIYRQWYDSSAQAVYAEDTTNRSFFRIVLPSWSSLFAKWASLASTPNAYHDGFLYPELRRAWEGSFGNGNNQYPYIFSNNQSVYVRMTNYPRIYNNTYSATNVQFSSGTPLNGCEIQTSIPFILDWYNTSTSGAAGTIRFETITWSILTGTGILTSENDFVSNYTYALDNIRAQEITEFDNAQANPNPVAPGNNP